MLHLKKFALGLLAVLFVSLAVPVCADLSKEDEREVNNYQLTEKKLGQFAQATKNLITAFEKNPEAFDNLNVPKETEAAGLTEAGELFDKIPPIKKAINDAGMTSREYWVFSISMVYAGTGHMVLKSGGKLPEGFSKANVDFYHTHEAAFMALDADLKKFQKLSDEKFGSDSEEGEAEEE